MAGVFVEALLAAIDGVFGEPGGGVDARVLDGELVEKLVVGDAGVALDDLRFVRDDERGEEAHAIRRRHAHGFDHQRVALPARD